MQAYRESESLPLVRDLATQNRELGVRAKEWRRAALSLVAAGVVGMLALGALALTPRRAKAPAPATEIVVQRAELGHPIAAIWADALEAYAVGGDGFISHHDREGGWHAVRSGTRANLHAVSIWGTGDARVGFAVGDHGTILRYTSATRSWSSEPSGTTEDLYGVAAVFPVAVAVGAHGTLLVRNVWSDGASAWRPVAAPNVTLRAAFIAHDSWQAGPAYVVGDDGTILSRAFEDLQPLNCNVPYPPSGDTCLVRGHYETSKVATANRLHAWNLQDSGLHASLHAIDGIGPDVYITTEGGSRLHSNVHDGTAWALLDGVPFASSQDLAGVATAYDGDVFVARHGGSVTRVYTRER